MAKVWVVKSTYEGSEPYDWVRVFSDPDKADEAIKKDANNDRMSILYDYDVWEREVE